MPRDLDLYRRLGLERGASEQDVHRAYRRSAKLAHPDVGGSPEKWGALCEAYDVLRDPRRRQRYDETGEVEGAAPDTHQAAVLMRIAVAMEQIALAAQQRRQQLAEIDWPGSVRTTLASEIGTIQKGIPALRQLIEDWDRVAARASVPSGKVNILRGLAQGKAEECRRRIAQAEAEIAEREEALALIADQTFAAEPGQVRWSPPGLGAFGYAGSAGRMW